MGTDAALAEGTIVSFKMTISAEEYATLGESDYLKVQAVVQQEDTWNEATVIKMGWPVYKAADFTENEDGTYSVVVTFAMEKAADIFRSLLIGVVGTNFSGDIDISDVILKDPNEVWSSAGAVSNEVTFGDAEDWNTWDNTIKATFAGDNQNLQAR